MSKGSGGGGMRCDLFLSGLSPAFGGRLKLFWDALREGLDIDISIEVKRMCENKILIQGYAWFQRKEGGEK